MNDLNGFVVLALIFVVIIVFGATCDGKKEVKTSTTYQSTTTEKVGEVVGSYSGKLVRGFNKGYKEQ